MKRSHLLLGLGVLVLGGCADENRHGPPPTASAQPPTPEQVAERLGPCAIAQQGYQPRLGLAVHGLQPRESDHPERLASLGFVTTCIVETEAVSLQLTLALPFLADRVEPGAYTVRDANETDGEIEKSWALASLLIRGAAGELEYRSGSGTVQIVQVSDAEIRGAYRLVVARADPHPGPHPDLPAELRVEGSFQSKPDLGDPYTRYALGRLSRLELAGALYRSGQLDAGTYRAAVAALRQQGAW